MPDASSYSPDYVAARARFRAAAYALDAHVEHHPLDALGPDGEDLSIDVARLGRMDARRVVVITSGLRGVEGFFGSAAQAALLEEAIGTWRPPADAALLLVHGLNPWGMAWKRRVNEDNVDLNRNFLLPEQAWRGVPKGYARVETVLHPKTTPPRVDTFPAWMAYRALREGHGALHTTIAAGQYDRPRGLFFGGNGPSRTSVLLREQLTRWFGHAEHIFHIDLQTGVGSWGRLLLLAPHPEESAEFKRLAEDYGGDTLVPVGGLGNAVRGQFLPWMRHHLGADRYEGLAAVAGTYGPIRLLSSLRAENRVHHHGIPEDPNTFRVRERMLDALNPRSIKWRKRTVLAALRMIQRTLEVRLDATRQRD